MTFGFYCYYLEAVVIVDHDYHNRRYWFKNLVFKTMNRSAIHRWYFVLDCDDVNASDPIAFDSIEQGKKRGRNTLVKGKSGTKRVVRRKRAGN